MENQGIIDTYNYPLIILGAGASHDFVSGTSPANMPVTDQLVSEIDEGIARLYPHVETLFSRVRPMVMRGTNRKTFEESLGNINDHEQLSGLRFYLQNYFSRRSDRNHTRINNYKALIDWIDKSRDKGAFVISFNYDTLFEKQLEIAKLIEMGDYVNSRIKLIKPHGSIDWFHIVEKTGNMEESLNIDSAYKYLINSPNFKPGPVHTERILSRTGRSADFWKIPALAVPVPNVKPFICPKEHIAMLTEALFWVRKILIIGWSANDEPVLELIQTYLKNPTTVYIVSGSDSDALLTKRNLSKVSKIVRFVEDGKGFSNFLGDGNCRVKEKSVLVFRVQHKRKS